MASNDNQALLLQVSADIRGLEKAFDRAVGKVKSGSKQMEASATGLEKFFGKPSLPKALDKVFDSTRFKILDSGAARVGLFGSALQSLGPIGLSVAGALGALGVAANQAMKAMDFGDEIGDTATKLQVTTDVLQEYRYAIHALGGETSDADAAIASFTETLGKAAAGAPKALKWFQALGFTQEELKSFKSADEAMRAVMARIGELPKATQRAAAASGVGLTAMIPAINAGIDKFDELREAAHRLGYVLDSETIDKLSDAKDEMEAASTVIKTQLAAAFSGLAVDIAGAMTALSQWLAQLRHVSEQAPGLFDAIAAAAQAMYHPAGAIRSAVKSARAYQGRNADKFGGFATTEGIAKFLGEPAGSGDLDLPGNQSDKAAQQLKRFNDMLAKDAEAILAALDNERHSAEERADIARQRLDAEEEARRQELADLVATKAITKAQADILSGKDKQVFAVKRQELDARLAAEIETANLRATRDVNEAVLGVLRAQAELATTAQERARLENEALDKAQTQARLDLDNALKNDPNKSDGQKAAERQALLDQQAAAKTKRLNDAANDIALEQLGLLTAGVDNQRDLLGLQLVLSVTAGQRREIELRLLDLAEQEERARLQAVIATKGISDADKKIAQDRLNQLEATHGLRVQGVLNSTRGPLEDYLAKLPNTAEEVNEAMQNLAVEGFQSLEDAIVDLATGARDAEDILRDFVTQMLAEFTRLNVEAFFGKQGTQDFLKSALNFGAGLFGGGGWKGSGSVNPATTNYIGQFANGTDYAPGGMAWVGERGKELMYLPRGSQIIPNDVLRGLSRRQATGSSSVFSPTLNMGVHFAGPVSGVEARRTGQQVAAGAMQELAKWSKRGYRN